MRTGRVFLLIGALVVLLSLLLSLILPEWLCWYKYEGTSPGIIAGHYLTGFGTIITKGPFPPRDMSIVVLIGGIIVIVGVFLCMVSAAMERKSFGIIGGILILLGPIFLVIDFLMGISELAGIINSLVTGVGKFIFWGTHTDMGIVYSWGLWIGFYMALVGGFLGLIGGFTV